MICTADNFKPTKF